VRAQQGYSIKKQSQEMSIVQPVVKTSLIDGRHLWSTALKAPIWLIVIFNLIIIGIWGLIIYILIGLSRLKKVA
jgi:hypothetical protein